MPLENIWVRAGDELIPVVLHPVTNPPEGYLSMQYRIVGSSFTSGEEKETTRCFKIPKSEMYKTVVTAQEEEARAEVAREGMIVTEQVLPRNLTWPFNTGVMCRVRNPDENEPRASRTFSEIFGSIDSRQKVWLCPAHILRKMGSRNPRRDPLHTESLYYKPWIWEGCIPYVIDAARHPAKHGFQNRRALQIAFPRTTELGAETWQITKNLVEQAFTRAQKGGFESGGTWIPYTCLKSSPRALSVKEAGQILGIHTGQPSKEDIRFIETQYFTLYSKYDPSQIDIEKNPDLWQSYNQYVQTLTDAYNRVILERLLSCRKISAYASRENQVAATVLSLIVWLDTTYISTGVVRIIYRKDAAERLGLKRGTIEYQYDEDGNLFPYRVKDTIEFWVRKLYLEPYLKQGYHFEVTVEGLEE